MPAQRHRISKKRQKRTHHQPLVAGGAQRHRARRTLRRVKAALLGLTYCLAKELGPDGITVNAILPGRIDTEMLAYATPERRAQWLQSTPLGRFGDTADIAELAVFLASDKGGYITGAKINVNGGLSTG